jgi:hypothetical protein
MSKSSSAVLALVDQALDDFDVVPLATSVRSAIRIATLLGETKTAIRLAMEVRPSGGSGIANAEDTRRVMADPEQWATPGGPDLLALEEYIADRRISEEDEEERTSVHSLAELEFWSKVLAVDSSEVKNDDYSENLRWRHKMVEVLDRTRSRTFTALCGWERQLAYAATNEQLLSGQQRRVDQALARFAPEVLDQFSAVFRRLQEAAAAQPDTAAEEELAQAVTSCRRILKAIVDTVQPADPSRPLSADGHSLTDETYKNRLFEFLKTLSNSARYSTALTFAGKGLIDRFDAMDALASKGVHASVARHEAEFCAMNTYLLAGEILQLHPVGAASSPP